MSFDRTYIICIGSDFRAIHIHLFKQSITQIYGSGENGGSEIELHVVYERLLNITGDIRQLIDEE